MFSATGNFPYNLTNEVHWSDTKLDQYIGFFFSVLGGIQNKQIYELALTQNNQVQIDLELARVLICDICFAVHYPFDPPCLTNQQISSWNGKLATSIILLIWISLLSTHCMKKLQLRITCCCYCPEKITCLVRHLSEQIYFPLPDWTPLLQ